MIRAINGLCTFFFPALVVLMEGVFRDPSAGSWEFAGPTLCATALSILISSCKVHTLHLRSKTYWGAQYEAKLRSEVEFTYFIYFLALGSIVVWYFAMQHSVRGEKVMLYGVSLPLWLGLGSYVIAQMAYGWKAMKYA